MTFFVGVIVLNRKPGGIALANGHFTESSYGSGSSSCSRHCSSSCSSYCYSRGSFIGIVVSSVVVIHSIYACCTLCCVFVVGDWNVI